jgi:hypothetical protein
MTTEKTKTISKPRKKRRKKKESHYQTGTHVSPKGGECKYRSGWELQYMQYLDANPDIASYEYEKVVVGYISNVSSGRIRKYWPDFLIVYTDGRRVLVEIKPKKRLANRIVQKKHAAAEQWCQEHEATLEIVTEDELKVLGLLK